VTSPVVRTQILQGFAKHSVSLAAANGAAISGHAQEETAKRPGYSPRLIAAAFFEITFL